MKEFKTKKRQQKTTSALKALLSWRTRAEYFIFELSVAFAIASIIAFIYLPVFSAGCIVIPIFALYYTSLFVWSVVLERMEKKREKEEDKK